MKLSSEELHVMRHTVGIGQGAPFFRNHFVAGEGHSDMGTIEDLIGLGLMEKVHADIPFIGGDSVFFVTDKGKELLMEKEAK